MIINGSVSARDMARIRGSVDPTKSTFYSFTGTVSLLLPGMAPTPLLGVKGASATRCVPLAGERWGYTMRELMLYTDVKTGGILDRWENPYTKELLPVVHIANDPVQGTFFPDTPVKWCDQTLVFDLSVYPDAPNPLYGEDRFASYGGLKERYSSEEGFLIVVPDFVPESDAPPDGMVMHWQRRVTWLPWMKMGEVEREDSLLSQAVLFYKAVALPCEYSEVDPEVRARLERQVPHFMHAPSWLENRPPFWGQNSWSYFKDNFESYLAGELAPYAPWRAAFGLTD
jgi:hypothetical protein